MGAVLVDVAEMTNELAVFTVICTLFITVIFILRLQGEDMLHRSQRRAIPPKPIPMVAVRNPFVLTLEKKSECSLKGVYCKISSQTPIILQAVWGVDVTDLQKLLHLESQHLTTLLEENTLLDQKALSKDKLETFDECENRQLFLQPSVEISSELGPAPRTKYPLVVIMVERRPEYDVNSEIEPQPRVVAMISVIHIKDEVMKDESYVYAQYLKQTSGQIVTLKPLYVATNDNHEPDVASDCNEVSNTCVVCQCEPVTRALLPCRHACVCQVCFTHLDKCPMCRGQIASYFLISEEPQPSEIPPVNLSELTWKQRLEFYMTKINDFMG